MIRNYIVVAIRSLMRDKLTTTINVLGLSVAIATVLILGVGLYALVLGDGAFEGTDRVYRVVTREVHGKGGVYHRGWQRPDLAEALETSFPEVVRTARVIRTDILMKVGDRHGFQETVEVDEPFLEMMNLPLVAGDRSTALSRIDQVVITKWLAERLFGPLDDYGDAIGKTVTFFGNRAEDVYTVSGVFGDIPQARTLPYQAMIRYENRSKYGYSNNWDASVSTYVELDSKESLATLEARMSVFSRQFIAPVWDRWKSTRWKDDPDAFLIQFQPLREIRFADHVVNTYENSVGMEVIWIEVGMVAMILLIASLNFTTLSIARSTGRTLEVGIRKVMGARRIHVVQQFWGEGLCTATLSVAGGLVLAEWMLPYFNQMLGADEVGLSIRLGDVPLLVTAIGLLGLVILVGIGAGTYPALVVSRTQPSETIRKRSGPDGKRRVSRVLLIGQYAMAVFLLVCTSVMALQFRYIRSQDLGYDADQVVVVQLRGQNRMALGDRFRQAVLELPGVESAAMADREFAMSTSQTTIRIPGGERHSVHQYTVEPGFFETMGIPLLSGRSFDFGRPDDRREAVIVNERLARMHDWEVAVGETLDGFGNYGVSKTPRVIGLVPDFHFRSFKHRIAPVVFHYGIKGQFNRVLVRVDRRRISETLDALRKTWTSMAGDLPFEYVFFDEAFARQYQADVTFERIATSACVIAIVIACMGLFGHAVIAVRQRTKEIGVRKVLGASVAQIGALLSRDLLKLVLVANVLAFPSAYWMMSEWLTNFYYRIEMGPGVFIACGLGAMVIALMTVGWIGVRAASEDPVEALRYE